MFASLDDLDDFEPDTLIIRQLVVQMSHLSRACDVLFSPQSPDTSTRIARFTSQSQYVDSHVIGRVVKV